MIRKYSTLLYNTNNILELSTISMYFFSNLKNLFNNRKIQLLLVVNLTVRFDVM